MAEDPETRQQQLMSLKIDKRTAADPEGIDREYAFDPADYDPDAEHGGYLHAARKDHLDMTWLEYLNAQAANVGEGGSSTVIQIQGDDEAAMDMLARKVAERLDVDADPNAIAKALLDDLSSDVRQSAYQGAKEAVVEAQSGPVM